MTAVVTIFGASISAAQEVDVAAVASVVDEAALVIPTTSSSTTSSTTTTTVTSTTAATPTTIAESFALADFVDADVEEEQEVEEEQDGVDAEGAGEDVPPAGFAVIDPAELRSLDGNISLEAAAPSTEVLDLVATIEEQNRQISVLSEQLAYLRQAQITNEFSAEPVADVSALAAKYRLTSEENAAALDLWLAGYTLGGGTQWESFRDVILPCESGSQPNPDTAVGRTDDWGRAQINRPVWKNRFESLTGATFEVGIVNPTLNGFMAAHVEQEQGLSAWTCWRKR